MPRIVLAVLALSAAVSRPAFAAERVFHAGPEPVALVELYTSEGCSSCPPAEQWLAKQSAAEGLWTRFVPVAFHVNYWDHLGWRDALASPAFTAREQAYASAWGAGSVYTPCFVRNGAEWRPPRTGMADHRDDAERRRDAGVLTLRWRDDDNTCEISYRPPTDTHPQALEVVAARLGGGIVSRVRRGENAGRQLRHEFVALRLETTALVRGPGGDWSARVQLAPRRDIATTREAIAAWVVPHGKLTALQSAGGWLDPLIPADSAQNMRR